MYRLRKISRQHFFHTQNLHSRSIYQIDLRGTVNFVSTFQRKRKTKFQSRASSPQVDGDDRHLNIESEPDPSLEPEPVYEFEPEPSLEPEPDHEPEPSLESELEPSLELEPEPETVFDPEEHETEFERYFRISKTLKYHCAFAENLKT